MMRRLVSVRWFLFKTSRISRISLLLLYCLLCIPMLLLALPAAIAKLIISNSRNSV